MPSNWQALLPKYADVIMQVGLNLRRGQRLLIVNSSINGVDVSLAPFIRVVAEAAYRRGASLVDVVWGDPALERMRLQKAPKATLRRYVKWPSVARIEHVEAGDAFLSIRADDPDLLSRIDAKLVGTYLSAIRTPVRPVMEMLARDSTNWCVVAASGPAWAAKVLPHVPEARRVARLWELILETCRVGPGDAVGRWEKHCVNLAARAAYLTRKQYAALHYSAPGTHLKVGLPPGHIWSGARMPAGNGIRFVANLPTEEVFTLPDCARVDGEVASTKPFEYGGNTISGMHLKFVGGKVVHFAARQGESILRELLRTDGGSNRLGEVALVPNSSPISRLGVTFHSGLFDENAACHLALGDAYRFCLKNAEKATDAEFARRGGNSSKIHYDFMVGSGKMDIDGLRRDGSLEPVMRSGEWAFAV